MESKKRRHDKNRILVLEVKGNLFLLLKHTGRAEVIRGKAKTVSMISNKALACKNCNNVMNVHVF